MKRRTVNIENITTNLEIVRTDLEKFVSKSDVRGVVLLSGMSGSGISSFAKNVVGVFEVAKREDYNAPAYYYSNSLKNLFIDLPGFGNMKNLH